MAGQGDDFDKIMAGVKELAEFAFKAEKVYSDTAYTKEFDQKFGDIFKAIRSNENLTDEQKSFLLSATNNTWSDIMGIRGCIRKSLRYQISDSLRAMNLILNNNDYFAIDKQFIETQLKEVYKKCTSYGVVDFEKVEEMAKQIEQQVAEMRKANKQQQEIGTLDTQIKIEGPIQIVEAEPIKQNDIMKWASQQIVEYQTFLSGIKESGDNIENLETKSIIDACKYTLNCLQSNYNMHINECEQGGRIS